MEPSWKTLFSENISPYEGYSIGKLLGLINDPAIISLAGADHLLSNPRDSLYVGTLIAAWAGRYIE